MPTIEEKAIFRKINHLKNKFKGVQEETTIIVSLLHNCLDVFDHRIKQLDLCKKDKFTSLYRKLNNDFEEFQEKLMYIQASIEFPLESETIKPQPCIEGDNESQNQNEPESSSYCTNSNTTTSSLSPNENVTSSDLDGIAQSALSSRLASHPSLNDLGNIESGLPSPSSENDKIMLENVTPVTHPPSNALLTETLAVSVQDDSTADMYASSSLSTSYASINVVEDSKINFPPMISEINRNNFPHSSDSERSVNQDLIKNTHNLEQISSKIISVESLSQASCHQSLSSNFSDYQSVCSGQDNAMNNYLNASIQSKNYSSQTFSKKRVISSIQIDCPVTTTATITHIENPGNFWMRLDSYEPPRFSFPKEFFYTSDIPSSIEVGDFFLAPSKSVPFYLRVKVVRSDINDNNIQVLFIDHGFIQNIPRNELRILPHEAYNIPMQAINCFLANISAPNGIWCYAAIRKLKEFGANSMETHIKCQMGDKYAVQLIATVCDFDVDVDIGQSLCIDGFAFEDEKHLQITDRKSASNLCDNDLDNSMQCDNDLDNSMQCDTDLDNSMQTNNKLSTDSGVSVTSNQFSTSLTQAHSSRTLKHCANEHATQVQNELQELCSERLVFQVATPESSTENKMADLISFESAELLQNKSCAVSEELVATFSEYNKCLKIGTCKCPLHLLIPFPSIKFVEQDMVLVMLSHITHPNEFYVNMAMESSITLDELLEQMFNTYNSPSAQDTYAIFLEDLRKEMFCAAWFNDGNWYRVKVLEIQQDFDQTHNVLVQYIDYGNKSWVKNTDLRTLTPAFAQYPSFSVKCSLAGVMPAESTNSYDANLAFWNEEAVNVFKNLISFENCLTAQICDRNTILNDDPLLILLWDTQGEDDVLLNKTFVDSGLAKFDYPALEKLLLQQNMKKPDVQILNQWDPMTDEYNNVLNSYGVNFDDIQVATDGYKPRDEEYICKYYSLRGYCPRKVCPYEHVPLAEGGVTRDQDELYSFNHHPILPKDGSYVLIQVSAVISPNFFFAQLPFGNLTVDELYLLNNQGVSRESLQTQEMKALYDALNKHYTNKPFDETTTVALSYGTIVVARRLYDQTWHRARITDVKDIAGPAKVFYVDFGNEEWVERKNIRQILPEFLHAPFQAVECCLYDVEPLGFEKGQKWSSYAVSCFKDLVSSTIMLAHVAYKLNDTLQVSLRGTTQNDHLTVREHLIRGGFGQEKLLIKTKKPASKYIPG